MTRKAYIPCVGGCGKLMWPSDAPQQKCRKCRSRDGDWPLGRSAAPPCERPGCTGEVRSGGRFCSHRCHGLEVSRSKADRWGENSKKRRAIRSRETVGLTEQQRSHLLAKWRRRGVKCYMGCGRAADSVDHVIPLVRGGTNYEGNLAPCCRPCNSSKHVKLLIEFKTNRQASSGYMPIRYRARSEKRQGVTVAAHEQACIVCGHTFSTASSKRKTCGDPVCTREWAGRLARDNYRLRVGIPVDVTEPTKYWLRFAS